MANINDRYSQNIVTPTQRGKQIIGGEDNSAFDAYSPAEEVQNAHVLQGAPTHLYEGTLDNNQTNAIEKPEVVDYQADADVERELRTFSTYGFPQGGPAAPATGGALVNPAGKKRNSQPQ